MRIGAHELDLPIIQGGMGVGVSLSGLAGAVAAEGGMGVISSVNCGYREEDFLENPWKANLRALEKEIRKAKEFACGKGMIGVNIMTAVSQYEETCRAAVKAGVDVILSGAGLPLRLPEFVKGTKTGFAPIVSSARAAKLLLRHYKKNYDMQPDFFVIEGSEAGGHLGFSEDDLLQNSCQSNEVILKEVQEEINKSGLSIPVFVGGGAYDGKDLARYTKLGAAGIQIATRMIATEECDASPTFKQVLVDCKKEDISIIHSPVGMPARAVMTPMLKRLEEGEKFLPQRCNACLTGCKKNADIPYCISRALIAAVQGDYENGLFFTGSNGWRVNKIVKVKELLEEIMWEFRQETAEFCI